MHNKVWYVCETCRRLMKMLKMDNFFKWLAKYIMLCLGLNFFSESQWGYYIFLVISNESIVKCLTRFGRFVKKITDEWKSSKLERHHF
jgi:hypothetical protein